MRRCLAITLVAFLASGAPLLAQERRDKPESEKPTKPEFKPPFGRGGPGFGPFRPPASREEAIERVRKQLEFARNMVRQLEEQLRRLETEGKPAADRKPEPRGDDKARKPDQTEARRPERSGKPEARRPGPGDKPRIDRPRGRFGDRRPPFGRGPQPQWGRWGFWPRFGAPWWPQPGRFAPGWPRWGWMPRLSPPAPRFGPPQRPTAPAADRARDLESRLDRLTRELEEIRRELRQRR
ncbi:MAG: hypothetical protein RMI91_07875 [Gemmatales bacterium]|nr:hypothetical protein [Gemmatales bacterium]MDW7994558.1 hypothetical protein [Gemmatales bacterium]